MYTYTYDQLENISLQLKYIYIYIYIYTDIYLYINYGKLMRFLGKMLFMEWNFINHYAKKNPMIERMGLQRFIDFFPL